MSKLRVCSFSLSVDGFGAGPHQDLDHPLGLGAEALMEWFFPTQAFQSRHGPGGGEAGVDNDFAEQGFKNIGAWIIGRNMFGPVRGPWLDHGWTGWWGEDPPYHVPVFVLTHHPRPPIAMGGGTIFHFITDGIEAALHQAFEAAEGRDVRLGGGVETVRQYLNARLVDEIHIAVGTALLGAGESLFSGLDLPRLGYGVARRTATARATHLIIQKTS